ncbi:hypothetical protein DFJ74DRAFT_704850 [Hyaloraphidium curvatum]|nr:hypothetical protein DFJ74DRAFT_704850 [Hyaloraphidium curvatum]
MASDDKDVQDLFAGPFEYVDRDKLERSVVGILVEPVLAASGPPPRRLLIGIDFDLSAEDLSTRDGRLRAAFRAFRGNETAVMRAAGAGLRACPACGDACPTLQMSIFLDWFGGLAAAGFGGRALDVAHVRAAPTCKRPACVRVGNRIVQGPKPDHGDSSKGYFCGACGRFAKKKEDLRQCAGCGRAYYCGKECQRTAWPEHKADCGSLTGRQQE